MARVIEIVKAHLEASGFDGLVAVDAECGCLCDDLAPCSSDFGQCEPGYRGMHAHEPGEWAIYRTKAGALDSVAKARHEQPTNLPQQIPNEFGHLLTPDALWQMYAE